MRELDQKEIESVSGGGPIGDFGYTLGAKVGNLADKLTHFIPAGSGYNFQKTFGNVVGTLGDMVDNVFIGIGNAFTNRR